jgi:TFIIF-interacting CTD phosphatase-like protein
MRQLILLDLDHTLIFGSYTEIKEGNLLFKHNQYLSVYERPFARKLVFTLHETGNVIVFTTALRSYAKKTIKLLGIQVLELLSRKQCLLQNGSFKKSIKQEWLSKYDQIIVIDDSPQVWIGTEHEKVSVLAPKEFHGQSDDQELISLIDLLNK